MSRDRSPQPVCSFLANLFGFAGRRSYQPSSIGQSYDPPVTNIRLSTYQYHEEHHPVHQPLQPGYNNLMLLHAIQPNISASIHHQHAHYYPPNCSVDPPHHQSRDVHNHVLQHPPVAQVPQPGTLLEQPHSNTGPSHSQPSGPNLFYQAHDFVIKDSVFVDNSSDNFMLLFLKGTIIGAEFDSSDPDMPLRCHPGTRTEIIKRCQDFILNCEGRPKLRWVVGAAGVGKSAIMQSVARDESSIFSGVIVGATVFFAANGRQDGTKTIMTIAYQLAVKLNLYRLFIQREVKQDPSLLRKSLSTQFNKFIIEPFIHQRIIDPSCRLLIIIDGLDECANHLTQQELLGLISDFCITYPTSPIVWMIASRPEPHITSFFSQLELSLSYEKEEILVNSGNAREDVKRYLYDKFREIQMASITLRYLPHWPSGGAFSKVTKASGGLFAYASTVVRYISDPTFGDPVSQLDEVLKIIENGTNRDIIGEDHPMAQLDALYARIISRIPDKVMVNTRKLLLLYVRGTGWTDASFHFNCNILGMTENAAYSATHHIRSITFVPGPEEAANDYFRFFHKSFHDYLRDFKRSGFSPNVMSEAQELVSRFALRVLEEVPDGVYMDGASDGDLEIDGGLWRNGPATGDNISLSWPAVGEDSNRKLRLKMFKEAVLEVIAGLRRNEEAFRNPLCMHVLTTCFTKLPDDFPIGNLVISVFDECRHREFLEHGVLKQVPLETLDYDRKQGQRFLRLSFRSPTGGPSEPWNTSCIHEREGNWEDDNQEWSTNFAVIAPCNYCFRRFTQHCKMQPSGHLVTIFNLDLTSCVAEFRFVDPDDGVSEWIYQFIAEYKVGDGGSETNGDK